MSVISQSIDLLADQGTLGATSFRVSILMAAYNESPLVESCLTRLLSLEDKSIGEIEFIVVDDGSTDGTWDVLQRVASSDPRVTLLRHRSNRGKGAAIRTAIAEATGDICIVHDADLEYNSEDVPPMLAPFTLQRADAVYGSRFMAASDRPLGYRHALANRVLTFVANRLTGRGLTDVETALKAIDTRLLKSIPLKYDDFRFEVELTLKLAKRRARIFEVPVRYVPRNRREGKKIGTRDGFLALFAMLWFWLVDHLQKENDEYGSHIL
jgi:glycosyltransferase involved in cell wall biosynthesis